MADEKPGEDEALGIAREWVSILGAKGEHWVTELAGEIREYGKRERAEVARSCVDRTAYGREVAALQEKRQQAEAAVEMWKRAAFESGEKLRETEALTTRRGQEREKAEAALEAAKAERDGEWVKAAQSYFEGVRPWSEMTGGFPNVVDFVIHEIWKRDPRVKSLVFERKVKELYEAGIAAKTELAAERALSAHRLKRIEEESKGWAAEREAHEKTKQGRAFAQEVLAGRSRDWESAEARALDLEGALRDFVRSVGAEALLAKNLAVGMGLNIAREDAGRKWMHLRQAEALLSKAGRSE